MPTVVVTHKVGDFDTWMTGHQDRLEVFGAATSGFRTFRDTKAPNAIVLVMDVTDMEKLGKIMADPSVQALKDKHTVMDPISVHVEVGHLGRRGLVAVADAGARCGARETRGDRRSGHLSAEACRYEVLRNRPRVNCPPRRLPRGSRQLCASTVRRCDEPKPILTLAGSGLSLQVILEAAQRWVVVRQDLV